MRRLLSVALVACTEPAELTFDLTANPVAVGATAVGLIENRTCDSGGVRCDTVPVDIASFTVEPEGVFEIVGAPDSRFSLRAIAAGNAALRIEASSDGTTETYTRGLVAMEPTGTVLTPECPAPVGYTLTTVARIPFELRSGDTRLYGADYLPFTATGALVNASASTPELLAVTMPADAGPVQVSSAFEPGVALDLVGIAPASLDRIVFGTPTDADVFRVLTVPVELYAGAQLVCRDHLSRTFATSTPEICTFGTDGTTVTFAEVDAHEVQVRGRAPGVCMIAVTLGGTSLTATTAITFTM